MSDQPTPEASPPEVTPAPAVPGNAGPADYPRMLYHADGTTIVVDGPAEHERLRLEGWAQEPSEIHRRPPPSPSPVMSGSDPLAILVRGVLEAVLDERGLTAQWVRLLSPGNPDTEPMNFPPRRT